MLTVFTANIAAIKFYESLKFAPDETSPCMHFDVHLEDLEGTPSGYEIYSKFTGKKTASCVTHSSQVSNQLNDQTSNQPKEEAIQ